jgi:hypothetical protein
MHSATRAFGGIALSLALSFYGCTGVRTSEYRQTGQTVEVEPGTGDTLITSYWQYDDGHTTATYKRIPRGNTDRRNERPPPPEARVRD